MLRAGAGYVVTEEALAPRAAAAAAAAGGRGDPGWRQAAYDYARDRYAAYRGGETSAPAAGVFATLATRMRGFFGRRKEYDEVSPASEDEDEDDTATTSQRLPV